MTLSSVMSCSRSVDKRLVLADTLMWTNPDSSLAILNAINRDSLTGDENRAYHALLLTQAQYRNYVTITSDTLIGKAVDYYSNNHNHEHYTRSLLYKGAAYEDMNNPIEAMKWYKQAEDNADTNDYRNLAQINMRMGIIYYNNFASQNLDLDKFCEALKYYNKLDDRRMEMICHAYIGNLLRNKNQDSARYHLTEAIKMAQSLKDSIEMFESTISLSDIYINNKDFLQAKNILTHCLYNFSDYTSDYLYYLLSRTYCGLNMIDSASFFFNKASIDNKDLQLKTVRLLTESEIFEAQGNFFKSKQCFKSYNLLADSLETNAILSKVIMAAKDHQEKSSAKKNYEIRKTRKYALLFAIILFLLFITVLYIANYMHKKRVRQLQRLFRSLRDDKNQRYEMVLSRLKLTEQNLELRENDLSILSSANKSLNKLLISHMSIMERLVKASYTEPEKKFEALFKEALDNYKSNCKIKELVDKYMGINCKGLKNIISNTPEINDEEREIIGLVALGFDYIDVAVIMGKKTNPMSTKFTRIARKLKSKTSLQRFVEEQKESSRSGSVSV